MASFRTAVIVTVIVGFVLGMLLGMSAGSDLGQPDVALAADSNTSAASSRAWHRPLPGR